MNEMKFEPINFAGWDWNNVLKYWVPGDPYQPEEKAEYYYKVRYAVAQVIKPISLCEIGVRAGYSMAAFLQCNTIKRYTGIDYNKGTDGGIIDYSYYAKRILFDYYDVKSNLHIGTDSQKLEHLPDGPYDLLYVDGDHSIAGTYHDIELGMRSARWILVDDIDFLRDVATGTHIALKDFNITESYYISDYGYRGNILIKNPRLS